MRVAQLIGTFGVLFAAAATCAAADGGGVGYPGTTPSALSPDGKATYITQIRPRRGLTIVSIWRGGHTTRGVGLRGAYGFPLVAFDGTSEGVSHDGGTVVLTQPGRDSRFAVLDGRMLRVRRIVTLRGQFSYDALSPGGRTLYLIQHVASRFANRYYVRAYDLVRGRLLRKIVFDRREKWGLMSGSPVTRATSKNGRWAYTLYTRPGGSPFVHALDTVRRKAVCIDLPWHGSQAPVLRMTLRLSGRRVLVQRPTGLAFASIDLRTFRVKT
jgi:hypothetical protein